VQGNRAPTRRRPAPRFLDVKLCSVIRCSHLRLGIIAFKAPSRSFFLIRTHRAAGRLAHSYSRSQGLKLLVGNYVACSLRCRGRFHHLVSRVTPIVYMRSQGKARRQTPALTRLQVPPESPSLPPTIEPISFGTNRKFALGNRRRSTIATPPRCGASVMNDRRWVRLFWGDAV
jgi:hypothetical protein